jgi:uncharacterized LabA/DUF88 family protein
MSSVAVFIDAGYLFAQGSVSLAGVKQRREIIKLNETAAMAELVNVAHAKTGNLPLLRVYWYDGARSARHLPIEHLTLAHTDYVKLRLGFITSRGEQKGVDSLIVTDLIELARNHAMTDAVLMSGDEDVRIGVQIAQSFGVRIHLIGIAPCRGNQSIQLMQEADTTTEWDASVIGKFLTIMPESTLSPVSPYSISIPQSSVVGPTGMPVQGVPSASGIEAVKPDLDVIVSAMISSLNGEAILRLQAFWETHSGLPVEVDGKLLARCRSQIGRHLEQHEKRYARITFRKALEARHT